MIRRALVIVALGAVLGACGGSGHSVAPAPPTTTAKKVQPVPKPRRKQPAQMYNLVVTILDGDRRVRVPHAVVRLWGRHGRTDRHGQTVIYAPRARHEVSVSAPGYTPARFLVDFRNRWRQTLRIYQPGLQWPVYGATQARTQAPTQIKLRPPFRLVWSRGMGQLIEFPAVVDNGFAFIGNQEATIHAISMRSGQFAWIHKTPGAPRMASSPAVDGNLIVYHTMSGRVYVLDRYNGRLMWSWNAGSAIESSPVVVGGIDYFGTAAGEAYALDLHRHRLRWSRSLGAKITSSVAISDGKLFIGDYAGRIWALSRATGATRWVGQANGKIYGTPAVANGRVFVPSVAASLTAFSVSGRRLWNVVTGSYVYSSPAVADGVVCFGSYDGWFYGVSAATGRILWRIPTGGPISGAAVIVDGIAYAGSFSHRIFGVDVHTGRRVLTFEHGDYVPVSGNGMRLLLHGFSRLYAVEPKHTRNRRLAR